MNTLTRSPCLEAAAEYAARGWASIPLCPPDHAGCRSSHLAACKKPGKAPLLAGWQNRQLTPDELEGYWRVTPSANVGVALGPLSGLCGLDVDGEEGDFLLSQLLAEHANGNALLETPQFTTGGGGHRFLLRLPAGEDPPQYSWRNAAGNEILRFQSGGGQTVMPPSLHALGGEYSWVEGFRPGECDLMTCPKWLIDLVTRLHQDRVHASQANGDRVRQRDDRGLPPARPGDRPAPPRGPAKPPPGNHDHRHPDHAPDEAEGRARAFLRKCDPAVSGAGGSNQAFKICCRLLHGFKLTDEAAIRLFKDEYNPRCEPPWSEKEVAHKIADARTRGDSRNYLDEPRRNGGIETNGRAGADRGLPPGGPPPDEREETGHEAARRRASAVASAADLIREGSRIEWIWEGWLAKAMLLGIAAEPGCGKTRFCADLARRIYHGMPWPDGSPATLPPGSPVLWVASDNQHPELAELPGQMGFPPEALLVNAQPAEPYGGTMLDDEADLKDLEWRIVEARPALVFIDTSTHATKRGVSKSEDATAFFAPLAEIARRTGVPIVCVTHLNANGQALGKRILGAVRVMIAMDQPDPKGMPDRRKLVAIKNNLCKVKPPLGVTMYTHGNEYDNTPPEKPEEETPGKGNGRSREKIDAAIEWLRDNLPGRVSTLRKAWEAAGHGTGTMYKARDEMGVVEDEDDNGRKSWSLPTS